MSYLVPDGTGPAGATAGGIVGGWVAGIVGVETGPADIPIVAIGREVGSIIGSAIEDSKTQPVALPDSILIAQNNKQIRKRIASLQDNIDEHSRWLDKEPNCPAANHWRSEIRAWQDEINRLQKRLPNGR